VSAPEDDPYWRKRKDGSKVHEPAPTPLPRSSKLRLAGLPVALVLLAGCIAAAGIVGYKMAPREIVHDSFSVAPAPPPVHVEGTPIERFADGALDTVAEGCAIQFGWRWHPTRAEAQKTADAYALAQLKDGAANTMVAVRKVPPGSPLLELYPDAIFISVVAFTVC